MTRRPAKPQPTIKTQRYKNIMSEKKSIEDIRTFDVTVTIAGHTVIVPVQATSNSEAVELCSQTYAVTGSQRRASRWELLRYMDEV